MLEKGIDIRYADLRPYLADHEESVARLMDILKEFHSSREATYQRSFARRGTLGVWINEARKYDRIDELVAQGNTYALIDTLVDLAMYSLKWVDIIIRLQPGEFREWLTNVYCRELGKDPEEVMLFLRDDLTDDDKVKAVYKAIRTENLG